MPYFTYDTSVIISRKLTVLRDMPGSFLMSAIALTELSASAKDVSELRVYEKLFRAYESKQRLIVPNNEDWLLTSRILSKKLADLQNAGERLCTKSRKDATGLPRGDSRLPLHSIQN
jgi:hypothetical protein